MALKEQDIVFTTTDEAGNPVIQFPITRVENVEDAGRRSEHHCRSRYPGYR